MVDKVTIGISTLIALGMILVSVVTPTFFDTPKYYCEAESSILECPGGLSGGSGTRCYLTEEKNSWDYCSSSWVEITEDNLIQEEATSNVVISSVPASTAGTKWICSSEKCSSIN